MENYFNIIAQNVDGLSGTFIVRLNPGCNVYQGHFPGSPVSPGVCNIQMMLECAQKIAQKPLRARKINRCRFTTLLTPLTHPELDIQLELQEKGNNTYSLNASIGKGEEIYQTLKAELIPDEQ